MALEIRSKPLDQAMLQVDLQGELNQQTADQLVTDLNKLIEIGHRRIIINCRDLKHISSYGLSVLLQLRKIANAQQATIVYAAVNTLLRPVLKIARLEQVLDLYDDIPAAQTALAKWINPNPTTTDRPV